MLLEQQMGRWGCLALFLGASAAGAAQVLHETLEEWVGFPGCLRGWLCRAAGSSRFIGSQVGGASTWLHVAQA